MQLLLSIVSAWAFKHKVAVHNGSGKSVVMHSSHPDLATVSSTVFTRCGWDVVELSSKLPHKWLGRRVNLQLLSALKCRCAALEGTVATLAGLASCHTLPLAFASSMFESKVDGSVRFGRWLLVVAPGAGAFLDKTYENWARALLGSPAKRVHSGMDVGKLGILQLPCTQAA